MKDLSQVFQFMGEAYYEITKKAQMKNAFDMGVEKIIEGAKKVPLLLFVLFAPMLCYIAAFGIGVYSAFEYFLANKLLVELTTLLATGGVFLVVGVSISLLYRAKVNASYPVISGDAERKPTTAKQLENILNQFSQEQHEIIAHLSSKLR